MKLVQTVAQRSACSWFVGELEGPLVLPKTSFKGQAPSSSHTTKERRRKRGYLTFQNADAKDRGFWCTSYESKKAIADF
jgi:hypothetical protein